MKQFDYQNADWFDFKKYITDNILLIPPINNHTGVIDNHINNDPLQLITKSVDYRSVRPC